MPMPVRSSKWLLFNFIFFSANDSEMNVCTNMCDSMSCIGRVFYHFTIFGFENEKKMKKIRVWSAGFYILKYR